MASFDLPVSIYIKSAGGHTVGNLISSPIAGLTREMVQQVRSGIWPWNNAKMVDQFPQYVVYRADGAKFMSYPNFYNMNGYTALADQYVRASLEYETIAFGILKMKLANLPENFAPFTFQIPTTLGLLKADTDACCAILDNQAPGVWVGSTKCEPGSCILTYYVRSTPPPNETFYPYDTIPWEVWGYLKAGTSISRDIEEEPEPERLTTWITKWEKEVDDTRTETRISTRVSSWISSWESEYVTSYSTTYTAYKWVYYQTERSTSRTTKWYTDVIAGTSPGGVDRNQRYQGHLLSQTYYERDDSVKRPNLGSVPNPQALDPGSSTITRSNEDNRNKVTYYVHNEPVQ